MGRWEMHQPQTPRHFYRDFQPRDGLIYSGPATKGHLDTPNDPVAEAWCLVYLLCGYSVSSHPHLHLVHLVVKKYLKPTSACVCAAGRVYSIVSLEYKGDATYGVSKTYIWALAELTCVLIVFCTPAIPKAFSSDPKISWVTRVTGYMKSWTRLPSLGIGSRKTSSREESAWQWREGLESDQGQQVSLDEVKLVPGQAPAGSVTVVKADLDPYQTFHSSSGIFKTTETHLEEQSLPIVASPGSAQGYYQGHSSSWKQGQPGQH